MKTPLIIIDMQPYFATAQHPLQAVLEQVRRAKKRNAHIFIVEYDGCGESYQEILDEVNGYKKVVKVIKSSDGGGDIIDAKAEAHGVDISKRIRVVGVNLSFCVYATVHQLISIHPAVVVEVPKKATWCVNPTVGLERLQTRLNCHILAR